MAERRVRVASVLRLAIPGAVFLTALGLARASGFTMSIPLWFFQLLDADMVGRHPIASLCYLHSQPPGLNALLGVVLATASATGLSPAAVAGILFAALGLVAAVVMWRTLLGLTGSVAVSTVALIAMVADPGYWVSAHTFFYEFLLHTALVLLLAATAGYLARDGRWQLSAIVALLTAIALTRTLYHPFWACGVLILVVALRARLDAEGGGTLRAGARALVVLLVLLGTWPLKNWRV